MEVGDYVRTKSGYIGKITEYEKHDSWGYIVKVEGTYNCYTHTGNGELSDVIKSSPNILELLEPQDLLYVDIDNDFEGGIIVPRIPETLNELNDYINKIKSGELILKGVVTHEQLMERMFEVNK